MLSCRQQALYPWRPSRLQRWCALCSTAGHPQTYLSCLPASVRVLDRWLHLHSFLRYLQVSGSKRLVSRMAAPTPNPGCMVCGTAQAGLSVNTRKMTLQQLVDKVGRLQGNAWAWLVLHVTDEQLMAYLACVAAVVQACEPALRALTSCSALCRALTGAQGAAGAVGTLPVLRLLPV